MVLEEWDRGIQQCEQTIEYIMKLQREDIQYAAAYTPYLSQYRQDLERFKDGKRKQDKKWKK